MARVCIVTPGQLGSNPRVVKEASALAEAGHAVTVICTRVLTEVEPRDRAVMASAPFRIRRIAFGHGWRWWLDRGMQVLARRWFAMWRQPAVVTRAISPMTRRLRRAALAERADLYIAHYPPALPAAADAARRRSGRYAFDAEDFHTGERPAEHAGSLDDRLIAAVERRYLAGAAYLSAASPGIADAYAATYAVERPTVILNTFPRIAAAPDPALSPPEDRAPGVYWFSQTLGPDRGIETAIRAIALSRFAPHLHLRGMASAGYAATIAGLADDLGIADRVHLLAPVAPDRLEIEGARHDIGYVGELGGTRNRQIALTNKLFSYLTSGLAIVASDIPAHRAIAPDLGEAMALFPIGDAPALADRLDRWLGDRGALARARHAARALGRDRFGWDRDKAVLVRRVEASLDR